MGVLNGTFWLGGTLEARGGVSSRIINSFGSLFDIFFSQNDQDDQMSPEDRHGLRIQSTQ